MENYSQICGQSTTTTTTNFDQAEKLAFDRASKALSAMRFASLPDLQQAGCSYYAEGFGLAGVSVSGEYIQRKAAKVAAWWDEKHTASRTTRPHSKFSKTYKRGNKVSGLRKHHRNTWRALQVQLARQGGAKVAEVEGLVGCKERFVYELSKWKFPKLVAVVLGLVLGQALNLHVAKSSLVSPPKYRDTDQKETLATCSLADGSPAASVSLGKTDDFDGKPPPKPPPNSAIVAELGAMYPQWASELAKLAS